MKIKHWAGYGSMNAQKVKLERLPNNMTGLHIRISGNHERGLRHDDRYDIADKLVKRFDKAFVDWRDITGVTIKSGYDKALGCEVCDYFISYVTPCSAR